MNASIRFEAARSALRSVGDVTASLCDPFVSVSSADGAAVSILAGTRGQSTVCASDDTAARLDELQFDLGEGPCWDAMTHRRPVFTTELKSAEQEAWPAFAEALRTDARLAPVASMYSFPLAVGALDIGAIDFWSSSEVEISPTEVTELTELAGLAAWQVLRRILQDDTDDHSTDDVASMSRREVHQATGMILAQLNVDAEEAALLLRAYAFSNGRSVREVASDVVNRRIDFADHLDD